jgi:hypothetical protein
MSNGLARKPGPECTHYNLVQDKLAAANALVIERRAGGAVSHPRFHEKL